MYSIIAAYVILIAYFAITESRRKGQAATTLKGGQFDHASTRLLSLAVSINITLLIVANALNYLQIGLLVDVIGWIGIVVMLSGITLRMWAVQTFHPAFFPANGGTAACSCFCARIRIPPSRNSTKVRTPKRLIDIRPRALR
ncbi:MAG: hypothetical protein ABSB81_07340 [Halobacteriota archaeon]|jgi:hypothetical protein